MKKDNISIIDFQKLDLRVGKVLEASRVEKSEKLIELIVDLGEDYGKTTILTGLQKFYEPEYFIGKKFVFFTNLEPKKMMGKFSNGMIMAVDTEEKPVPLEVDSSIKNGSVIR